MNDDFYYIIGPGTTTRAIMQKLDLGNSLLGIDIVHKKKLIAQDLNELQLLNKINGKKCKLIITPIGGQGYILGRGNQQLSPDVLKVIGKDHVIIVATAQKINSLQNRSLLVDTGDRETDLILSDYFRIVTGYHESRVYKVTRLVE
jgi:predicted polyphosphate/ATP-dependent NAD kinase